MKPISLVKNLTLAALAAVWSSFTGPPCAIGADVVWPIPGGDGAMWLESDAPVGSQILWQWATDSTQWTALPDRYPAHSLFRATEAGALTAVPAVPVPLPELSLTFQASADGSCVVNLMVSQVSVQRRIATFPLGEDGAVAEPTSPGTVSLDVTDGPTGAVRLKVTLADNMAPGTTVLVLPDLSVPPAGVGAGAWAPTVALIQGSHDRIVAALVASRQYRYPRRDFMIEAYADDSAWICTSAPDGSPLTCLVPSFPLRDPAGEALGGYAEWDTVEEIEGDRRHYAVWVFRRQAPHGAQATAAHPRTVPPGPPPQLTEVGQEAMGGLLARRTALIHRLRFPTPHPMTMPNPALSDRAMPSRQLFRAQVLSAFSRDVAGGGPQGDQPDGIADLLGSCTHPVITEICAANHGSLLDADGKSFDWIEIYNPTAASVDLTGWQLVTTTSSKTTSWAFPAGATAMASGAYLIVYATDLPLIANHPLHSNLKLSANGGTVRLKNPSGVVQDECGFAAPLQWSGSGADWCFGLGAAVNGTLMQGYFLQSTPGTHNDTNCYGTRCQPPVVEVWRGAPGGAQSTLLASGHGVWVPDLPNPNDSIPDDYYVRLMTPSLGQVPGERVHYTANATPPTAWSAFTTGAAPAVIPLTGSTVIRCFTAHEGDCQSEPLTVSVLFRSSVLAPQAKPAVWPAHKDFPYY